ncbi:WLM domain-containing protein [Stachybotrys elegans]|uniref:WLM domain-containing protein n=1 Tax=Stachybotrys elegans TaxID=80388 RepID=A0A8K0T770_9HYPO|nr:WLM domain-containing protein [Stachybotrys elegans]
MPWGVQRLNAKRSQPNPNIVFIKPLQGPDERTAQDFLERIAAQCVPIMREHHLYVMSLEEYEPNREFVGRNFNAGEVIQLVLKSPRTGRWLPFQYVQMVMMHELAHCKQMNHSRAFWAVRNQYAAQMQGLWSKSYIGEGIWGRGISLGTAEWERNAVQPDEVLPEHLCGGTYRSRRRKRKAKPNPTYQERKEKRILKKFGKNGVALGADDEVKVKLENGKRVQGKPRVAGSARGRELRAAAALARFSQPKEETKEEEVKDESETESGSDADYEEDESQDASGPVARDANGAPLTDDKGRSMVKVCEGEDTDDVQVKNELDELQSMLRSIPSARQQPNDRSARGSQVESGSIPGRAPKREEAIKSELLDSEDDAEVLPASSTGPDTTVGAGAGTPSRTSKEPIDTSKSPQQHLQDGGAVPCSVCSYANEAMSATCGMCANVLDPRVTKNAWSCTGESCKESTYLNSGDCGICGLCGQRRT